MNYVPAWSELAGTPVPSMHMKIFPTLSNPPRAEAALTRVPA